MTLVELSGPNCPACRSQEPIARAWARSRCVDFEVLSPSEGGRGLVLAQACACQTVPTLAAVIGERVVYAEPGLHFDSKAMDRFWRLAESMR